MKSLAANNSIPIVLIPLYGTEEMAGKIEYYLRETYNMEQCHVVNSQIVRFSTGDAKAVLEDTVRGADVYILVADYMGQADLFAGDPQARQAQPLPP